MLSGNEAPRSGWLVRLLLALGRSFCAGCCAFWTPYAFGEHPAERAASALGLWNLTQAQRWFDEQS